MQGIWPTFYNYKWSIIFKIVNYNIIYQQHNMGHQLNLNLKKKKTKLNIIFVFYVP